MSQRALASALLGGIWGAPAQPGCEGQPTLRELVEAGRHCFLCCHCATRRSGKSGRARLMENGVGAKKDLHYSARFSLTTLCRFAGFPLCLVNYGPPELLLHWDGGEKAWKKIAGSNAGNDRHVPGELLRGWSGSCMHLRAFRVLFAFARSGPHETLQASDCSGCSCTTVL